MSHDTRGFVPAAVLSAVIVLGAVGPGWGQVYCNLTKIEAKPLTNGVQIVVQADGLLEWEPPDGDYDAWWEKRSQAVTELAVRFPGARSKLTDSFIDVSVPPVSYVQVSVPQDAPQGIGVEMRVVLSEPARFDYSTPPDRQSWMLMFRGERTVERETEATSTAADGGSGKETALEVRVEDGRVWVKATNADIHEVIGEVARQAGINAAVDDAVKHKVSLRLSGLEPLAVLRGIASGYGLALSQDGDVIMISEGVPRDMATYNRSETASFPMRFLRAGDAQSLLPTFLFSYLHANMEQNAVVVTAPSQMLAKIEGDLRRVDVAPPLIMVEVLAVELTNTRQLTAGLRWKYFGTSDQVSVNPATGAVGYRSVGPDDFVDDNGVAVTRTRHLAVKLDALAARGQAKIRANPRMAAVNGQEAEIFIGAQRFVKISFLQWGQQQERIQSVPVGVKLQVTPWTGGNREITSHLVAEVSNIVEIDPQSGLPLLSTRRAESTVRAADGETIFIGGLTQEQEETRKTKVPVLGDLPVLGSLFRHASKTATNTDLVLLVTPRLLTEEGQLPDADTERAIREQFLEPDDFGAVTPEEPPPPAVN